MGEEQRATQAAGRKLVIADLGLVNRAISAAFKAGSDYKLLEVGARLQEDKRLPPKDVLLQRAMNQAGIPNGLPVFDVASGADPATVALRVKHEVAEGEGRPTPTIGDYLRRARAGRPQGEIAKAAGISVETLARYESDGVAQKGEILAKIGDALGVPKAHAALWIKLADATKGAKTPAAAA